MIKTDIKILLTSDVRGFYESNFWTLLYFCECPEVHVPRLKATHSDSSYIKAWAPHRVITETMPPALHEVRTVTTRKNESFNYEDASTIKTERYPRKDVCHFTSPNDAPGEHGFNCAHWWWCSELRKKLFYKNGQNFRGVFWTVARIFTLVVMESRTKLDCWRLIKSRSCVFSPSSWQIMVTVCDHDGYSICESIMAKLNRSTRMCIANRSTHKRNHSTFSRNELSWGFVIEQILLNNLEWPDRQLVVIPSFKINKCETQWKLKKRLLYFNKKSDIRR